MKNKLSSVLDTHRRNLRFAQYDLETVMLPLDHAADLVGAFHKQKAAIDVDRNLTHEGKVAARLKLATTTREALKKWHDSRVKGLDADLLQQRAALMTQTERPDQTRVALLAAELVKFSPHERMVLYNAAPDPDRRVMEAASVATGALPVKSAAGLEWKPLLDPEMVNEAILQRAAETNPAAAAKVQELVEIRGMQTTIMGVAESEIREALPDLNLGQ